MTQMKRFRTVAASTAAAAAKEKCVVSGAAAVGGVDSEVSFKKLSSPICVPNELNLERFCSNYTANAPTGDLREVRGLSTRALVRTSTSQKSVRYGGAGGHECGSLRF